MKSGIAVTGPIPNHLRALDGIRGGAALWVLLSHCLIWGGGDMQLLPDPKIAVDIFMVVSGFLMVHVTMEREGSEPPGTWIATRDFWIRRFFRIAPLYYLALVLAFSLAPMLRDGMQSLQDVNPRRWENTVYRPENLEVKADNILLHFTFLFGLLPGYVLSAGLPDWSIGLEMQFYAVFPLLVWLMVRLGPVVALLLGWAAAVLVKDAMPLVYGSQVFPEPSFLALKLPLFLIGMAVAAANHRFVKEPAVAVLLLLLALFLATKQSGFILLLVLILVFSSSWIEGAGSQARAISRIISAVLGCRVASFLADTSYAVYLFHGFFIKLFGGWLYVQPWAERFGHRLSMLTLGVLLGSYSLGWLLHRWVERPGIRLGRFMIKRCERPQRATALAAGPDFSS